MLLKGSELNHYRSTEDFLLDIYLTTNSVKIIISFFIGFSRMVGRGTTALGRITITHSF